MIVASLLLGSVLLLQVAPDGSDAGSPPDAAATSSHASDASVDEGPGGADGVGLLDLLGFGDTAARGPERGLRLLRQARRAVDAGDAEGALELMDAARVEWPGSPYVAQSLGDLHLEQGRVDEALSEFARGERDGFRFRSAFQSAVALSRSAEQELSTAGVPEDEAALPEGPLPPGMGAAIKKALPSLESARREFCEALAQERDARARESVLALTRRIDELRQMLERADDQQDDQQGDDGEQGDEDQQGDQDGQDDQQGDQGKDEQDDPSKQQPQDGEQQPDEQQQDPQDPSQDDALEPIPYDDVELTPQQMAELVDKLDDLEQRAMRIRQNARQQERQGVEKDW